jgi:hypothetical protein
MPMTGLLGDEATDDDGDGTRGWSVMVVVVRMRTEDGQ